MRDLPLIVIVGPTASGKSSLAIRLAKKYGGEIICADSRTVYKGMDIGTAKPTIAEQSEVPHWGLDLLEPGAPFSAADFKEYAMHTIDDIRSRGKIPFMVGGTGLYVDAVVFDYEFGARADPRLREELNRMSLIELHNYCYKHNINLPENLYNKRHVVRKIELKNQATKRRQEPIPWTYIVGLTVEKDSLLLRMQDRADAMFANGVVEEASLLAREYGWKTEALTGNVYPIIHRYLQGEVNIEQAKQLFVSCDWRLSKRQLTWFRRNSFIKWLTPLEAERYLSTLLAHE